MNPHRRHGQQGLGYLRSGEAGQGVFVDQVQAGVGRRRNEKTNTSMPECNEHCFGEEKNERKMSM